MNKLITLIIIFIPYISICQIDSLVRPANMTSLLKFEKAYHALNRTFTLHTPLIREILPNIRECMYKIEETIKYPDGGPGNRVLSYEINFLVKDTVIFWYQSFEKKYKKTNNDTWEPILLSVKSFKNKREYLEFEKSFFLLYKTELNSPDLLNDKIVYGIICTNAGAEPEYRGKIMALLSKNNIIEIRKWLTSPNVEKQVYAIDAIKLLERNGRKITSDEYAIIKLVKSKKGNLNTCFGCVYTFSNISEADVFKY